MLLYFFGPDTYRLKRYVAKVAGEYEKKYSSAPERFDMGEDGELARLAAFCGGRSLFVSKQCAVVDVSADQPKELKPILKAVSDNKNITLIIESDHKLTKEFDAALKEATAKEFETLEGAKQLSFIKEEATQLGLVISDAVIREVATAHEGNLWAIMTELSAMHFGKKFEAPQTIPAFFPLIQGIKGGGVASRQLGALHQLLEHHEAPAVFNMIASMADPSTKMQMADYDVAIKSGKMDYPEALLDLVLSRN